jgi:hypothetical protein
MTKQFKNVTVTIESLNMTDAARVLKKQGISATVIEIRLIRSTYLVRYTVNGKKCATFLKTQDLISAKIESRVKSSQNVEFNYIAGVPGADAVVGETSNGHSVEIDYSAHTIDCTCKDFGKIALNGKSICKHSIKFAKATLDVGSLTELVEYFAYAA